MLFLSLIFKRTVRVIKCFARSLPAALSASALAVLGGAAVLSATGSSIRLSAEDCFLFTFIIVLAMWAVVSFIDVLRYGTNIHHMYDDDIIGKAFTGFGRKSVIFETALADFNKERYQQALDGFSAIEQGNFRLSDLETGVVNYYRGRCYQIMGFLPNAAKCYEKSTDSGFFAPYMPFFLARCYGGSGDTERALMMYSTLMEGDPPLSSLARTEAGHMYLKLNDGKNALIWFNEAIDRHENYAEALGGAAVAHTLLGDIQKGEELYKMALLNKIHDPEDFMSYFKQVQAAVMLEPGFGSRENK